MKKLILCHIGTALLYWATVGVAVGQSLAPSDPMPAEPLLPRARDGSWSINYKYKDSPSSNDKTGAAASTNRVSTIKVEKKGKVYHVLTTKVSGNITENWCVEDIQITKPEGAKSFVRLTAENPLYLDFSKTDFDELSWIGMDDFKGVKEVSGELKILIFEVRNAARRPTAQEAAASGNLAAMEEQGNGKGSGGKKSVDQLRSAQYGDTISKATLDVVSQLPIEYDNGYFDRTYSFSSTIPPNAPIDIIQLLQTMREQKRRTFVRASPP